MQAINLVIISKKDVSVLCQGLFTSVVTSMFYAMCMYDRLLKVFTVVNGKQTRANNVMGVANYIIARVNEKIFSFQNHPAG